MRTDALPADEGDFVELLATGTDARGEFECAECGYGAAVTRALPTCPMCRGESWQRVAWKPMQRARDAARHGSLAGL